MTILLATLMPAYAVLLLLIVGALVFVRKRRSRKRAVKLMNRSKLMARNLLYSEAGTVVKHKRKYSCMHIGIVTYWPRTQASCSGSFWKLKALALLRLVLY